MLYKKIKMGNPLIKKGFPIGGEVA